MPGGKYKATGLGIPQGSFGPVERFLDQHGLPDGREKIAREHLALKYEKIKTLVQPGALNEGIHVVRKISDGQKSVMKVVKFNEEDGRVLLREIEILHILKHPNIVAFVDGYIPRAKAGYAELYMEYCDGGSLQDLLDHYIRYNQGYKFPSRAWEFVPESFIWLVFLSLAKALAYLHFGIPDEDRRSPPIPLGADNWPCIMHRDLKLENVLLKNKPSPSSAYPIVVLADFVSSSPPYEAVEANLFHRDCVPK